MGRVFRSTSPTKDKSGRPIRRPTRKWYIEYADADGRIRREAAYTDKQASKALLAGRERQVARRRSGLIDPYDENRKRPLVGHLEDWQLSLSAKGNTDKHARLVSNRARKLLAGIRAERWEDLDAGKVEAWLAEQRQADMSRQTSNFYLQAIKQFCRWMVQARRAPESPLTHLRALNVKVDRQHDRRALMLNELQRLLEATSKAPVRYNMIGPERAMLYHLAVETGLRASELRSLTRGSFNLDGDPPTVTVKAAYSKHRDEDILPIRPALGAAFK